MERPQNSQSCSKVKSAKVVCPKKLSDCVTNDRRRGVGKNCGRNFKDEWLRIGN